MVASDNIEGLKPGFFVIIAATPRDKHIAEEIVDVYKRMSVGGRDLSGAYIREVRVMGPDTEVTAADFTPG